MSPDPAGQPRQHPPQVCPPRDKKLQVVKICSRRLRDEHPHFGHRRFRRAVLPFRFTLIRVQTHDDGPRRVLAFRRSKRASRRRYPQGYSSHRRCSTASSLQISRQIARTRSSAGPSTTARIGITATRAGAASTPRPASGTSEGSSHSAPPRRPPSRLLLAHPPPGRRPRPQAAARRPFQRRP